MRFRHLSNTLGQLALVAAASFLVWMAANHPADSPRHCRPGCTVCAQTSIAQSRVLDDLIGNPDAVELQ